MSLETIDKWFLREVMQWRCGAAIAWSVLCLPVMSALYVTLANLQPLHPLSWVAETSSCIVSAAFLSSVAVIMLVNGFFHFYTKQTYSVLPTVSISRVSHLTQLLTPAILAHTAVCIASGLVIAWIATCLLGDRYTGLSARCDLQSSTYVVNEYHIFLVLYGGFTGLLYVVSHYIHHGNLVVFPHTQQGKFAEARCQLVPTTRAAAGHVLWQIKYFYLLYFCFGGIPRDFIASTLSLKYGPGARLDTVYGLLLDVRLFWQALLVGVFIQLSWALGALLYKLYNTEGYEFPISTMFENFQNKCLVDALKCTKLPLLQALGFQDLTQLSQHSYVRRRELFSLSQPGGHPKNWNNISSVCLDVIKELSDSVQEVNWKILAGAPVRQPNTEKAGGTTAQSNGETTGEGEKKSTVRERIVNGIKKRKVLTFFTGDSTESKSKNLFVSVYVQIWAVEALAWLVKVSVTEDLFGVVQMSLPDIISSVLSLHENVEKHFKLTGGVARRSQRDTTATNETLFKHQLQTALKSSIYTIVNTFGQQLLEVRLSPETEKKLHHFLDYRE